jgi:hypothetical protein
MPSRKEKRARREEKRREEKRVNYLSAQGTKLF